MGNSKRALDEIRTAAGAGSNAGSDQKKSWLKKIKEFWYQCLWRNPKVNPKVAQEQPEKITQEVAQEQPKKITLDEAVKEYKAMKSKNVWHCPW